MTVSPESLLMRLFFLCGVIFRILRQVAMRARFGDLLDNARTVFRLALFQLDPQGGIAARGHRDLFDHLFCPSIARAAKVWRARAFL